MQESFRTERAMAEGMFISRIEGTRGEVRIPSLGILVGELASPLLLRRRGDQGSDTGQWDLHAAFRYLNVHLFTDEDYDKEFTIWVGKRPMRLLVLPTTNVEQVELSLRMKGVNIEWAAPAPVPESVPTS